MAFFLYLILFLINSYYLLCISLSFSTDQKALKYTKYFDALNNLLERYKYYWAVLFSGILIYFTRAWLSF